MDNKTVFSEIWCAYRHTILHNIVTSFGLDFLVTDNPGGDVDTIHGVRETGTYKNPYNADSYENRGSYNQIEYHHNDAYDSTIRLARESQSFIDDAYVPGNRIFYGKASSLRKSSDLGTNQRANLDHVISAKEIHDDPGRVLAEMDGVQLANEPDNLRFTNEHLNKSMGSKSIEEYVRWREEKGDPLPTEVKEKMLQENKHAREAYEKRIADAYYSSDKFLLDAANAAMNRGLEMGLRQVLGFVFIEIWFACEDNIKSLPAGVSFKECSIAIANGIKAGFDQSCRKYKTLLSQFGQGFTAGALASLTTTLINIFITTDKNTARYIREGYTTIVQVGDILLINPDDLLLGNQLKSATVALATGASIIAGTAVGNKIALTPLGQNSQVGYIVQNFCGAMVSGLISCTFLVLIDRSAFISNLIERMDQYGTIDHEIHETSSAFIELAAQISDYDITSFQESVDLIKSKSSLLLYASDDEVHEILMDTMDQLNIPLPWEGDFDSFMSDSSNHLVFD